MADPNVQDRNVGNRGDVVKHVALVALADLLRARNPGLVRHVETHTFRLHAPLPDAAAWRAHVAALDPAATARYLALQARHVAEGRYRCSAGLVADALGAPVSLLLAEAHAPTREALAAALAEEGLPVEALVDDALVLAAVPPGPPAPLLVHVDPFDAPHRYWPTVERLLGTWRRPDQDAVVLAFGYDKHAPVAWPEPPADLVAVGTLDARPYGLAAWASRGIASRVEAELARSGW